MFEALVTGATDYHECEAIVQVVLATLACCRRILKDHLSSGVHCHDTAPTDLLLKCPAHPNIKTTVGM